MQSTLNVLSEDHIKNVKPAFNSDEEFFKIKEDFLSNVKPDLDTLDEKRRMSEFDAQSKRYR